MDPQLRLFIRGLTYPNEGVQEIDLPSTVEHRNNECQRTKQNMYSYNGFFIANIAENDTMRPPFHMY